MRANLPPAYGRVANMKVFEPTLPIIEDKERINLVDHFNALLLAIFSESGLLDVSIPRTLYSIIKRGC